MTTLVDYFKSPEVDDLDPSVVCAWCEKVLYVGTDDVVSHGICDDCLELLEAGIKEVRE